jgi:hypothetical protein
MQKESSLFFSFPSDKDSKLVSLGSSKNFGKAKVTKKREKCKRKALFFSFPSERNFGKAKVTKVSEKPNNFGFSVVQY